MLNNQAKQIEGQLHNKTHYKAVQQMLYGLHVPQTMNESQNDIIKNLIHMHHTRINE